MKEGGGVAALSRHPILQAKINTRLDHLIDESDRCLRFQVPYGNGDDFVQCFVFYLDFSNFTFVEI